MKHIKSISRAYTFQEIKPKDILELLGLFCVQNVFLEISNIEKNSNFYKNIQNEEKGNVLFQNFLSNVYADILITQCCDGEFSGMLNQIISSNPETLTFYLTDLPLEEFLCYNRKNLCGDYMVTNQIVVCAFDIMFDENVFIITFKPDLPQQADLLAKIEEICSIKLKTASRG